VKRTSGPRCPILSRDATESGRAQLQAQRTFVAIHTLVRDSLIEDALCLLRVLVENTINLEYGIKSDTVQVVRRYFDWAMLDAIRRASANEWFLGISLHSEERKQNFLRVEAEIRGRYSSEDFESLKRNVFGISLETRAQIAGLSELYDASYRVLSRNVHAMDIAVTELARSASTPEEYKDLLETRTSHVLDIAQWCLGTLANWVNGQFRCGYDDQLNKLQARASNH
jgi:uncharacterized protein DUF5677